MNTTLQSRAGDALLWQALQVVGVKGVHFLRLVILARILVPEDFGLLAISTVTLAFLLAATDPGMLPALVQKSDPAPRDYDAAWTVGMVRALVVAGPLILSAPWIAELFQEPRAAPLIRVLALQPVFQAAASIRVASLVRDLHFRQITGIQITEALVNTLISVVLAPTFGVWALVWGPLAGSLASAGVSYLMAPHRPRPTLEGALLRPLIVFGRWIFVAGMLGVGSGLVLQMAISRTLGAAELGLYALAVKLAYLAWDSTSMLVDKVSFPVYARLQQSPDEARETFQFLLTALAVVLVPVSMVLIVLAPGLVDTVLGNRWEGTAPLIQILAAVVVLGLLGDSVMPLLLGFGRPRGQALVEGIQFLVLVVLVWPFLHWFGVSGAAWAVLVGTAASQPLGASLAHQVLPRPFSGLLPVFGVVALYALASVGTAWAIHALVPGTTGVVGALLASMIAVGLLLRRLDGRLEPSLGGGLRRFFPRAGPILDRILPRRRTR